MTLIVITGVDPIQKALEGLDGRDRQNTERRAVRAAGKPFQTALKAAASSANVPRSFQKVPAIKISTRGGVSGRDVVGTVRPKSPLFNIFEPGAREHTIAPGSRALGGPAGGGSWDPRGRKRPAAFFSGEAVRHPGMKARPILPTAFNAASSAAFEAFTAVILGQTDGKAMGDGA